MKVYKIRLLDTKIYVEYVLVDCDSGELKFDVCFTFTESKAAVYDEDKAYLYLNKLNEQYEGICKFELEAEYVVLDIKGE